MEGTLTAVESAVNKLAAAVPADAGLLAVAVSQVTAKLDAMIAEKKSNGVAVMIAVDAAQFRCVFSVTPRTLVL